MDVTGEEFEVFMEVLGRLNYTGTEEGAREVATLISEQAELNSDFQVSGCGQNSGAWLVS